MSSWKKYTSNPLIQVAGVWVDPAEVIAVTPWLHSTSVVLHLSSGAQITIQKPEHINDLMAHVTQKLGEQQ